jgi:hypothetical protein
MAKLLSFDALKELKSYLSTLDTSKKVFLLFTALKDEDGVSWCPDCNEADPVLTANLKYLTPDSEFLTCYVGEKALWKNQDNEFRKDPEFKLKCIPTIIQWKTNKILSENQCATDELVKMLFVE